MALTSGTRLGSYEIIAAIGAGGMGEVYRARDTRLGRDVAIKVLPESVAGDPEHLARFQREAQVLASLNHPNIAHIHGLEESNNVRALVMELVEGLTLAERIEGLKGDGGGLPLDEALAIAKQIADALEAAHEQGIVHRDLKPANIKVRPDGTVKVLDFGLAKALEPSTASGVNLTASPTITTPAMTRMGMILGTAAYMSPEQARGRTVDKRTDIWAFGAVLFEMLTGSRPFDGEDIAEVLGAVIHKDVNWTRLPATTPTSLRTVLERCLEKDPKQRVRDIGDVRLMLAGAFGASSSAAVTSVGPATSSRTVVGVAAAVALVAAVIGAGGAWVARAPATPETIAFSIDTPNTGLPESFALSPDGRQLAFVAIDRDGRQKLWIRSLAATVARVIPGTEQAVAPFWSPDSRKVAFFGQGALKSVDVAGGTPQSIASTSTTIAKGGTWSDRDVILFARAGTGILRVAATGGEPTRVTTEGALESHGWPEFLPDGRHFIYLDFVAGASELRWRDLDSNVEHVIRKIPSRALYSPTGHLLFRLNGPIVAQAFDPSSGKVSGDAVQVAGDTSDSGQGRVAFALSPAGVLAHRGGQAGGAIAQLSWLDRSGKVLNTVGPPGDYRNPVVDPASEHVAANINRTGEEDVWVFDVKRGTTSRLTFDAATDSDPAFSPDGRSVAFYSNRNPPGIYRKASSGAGADELIAQGLQSWPRDWSLDGRFLIYQRVADLWVLPMDGQRTPWPYLATPARETDGHFSPDERWVAYTSDETGREEVFVQDFPAKGAKFQVSTTGGSEARWRRDGGELFYVGADGRLMSVNVQTNPDFKLDVPTPVFQTRLMNLPLGAQRRYGVSADGQRFMMNIPMGGETLPPITVIVNWPSALRGK